MDLDAFFLIVQSSRLQAEEPWAFQLALLARLSGLTDDELWAFDGLLGGLREDLRELEAWAEARWGLGAFEDFCSGVLWRGREAYEALVHDPGLASEEELELELRLPVEEELARRGYPEPEQLLLPVDRAVWARRAEAEGLLLRRELPRAWREHDDLYVRALAWLAHPPPPHPELFDSPLRAAVYLAARRPAPAQPTLFGAPPPRGPSLRPEALEPLTALLWLEDHAPPPANPSRMISRVGLLDREAIVDGLLPSLREGPASDAVLASRLSALAGRGHLSPHDPLSLRRELLTLEGGPVQQLPHLDHPLAWTLVRALLGGSYEWVSETIGQEMLGDEDYVRPLFCRALREVTLQLGLRGLARPVMPMEEQLLQAIERSPDDLAPQLVYADWCAQMELVPRPGPLLRELRRRLSVEGTLSELEVALILAQLGDPAGLDTLLRELGHVAPHRDEIMEALFALGPQDHALSAQAGWPKEEIDLDLAALRVWLWPDEPSWLETLYAKLHGLPRALQGREDNVRRALRALRRGAEHQPARLSLLEELVGQVEQRLLNDPASP
jgi:hypothetical protein